MDMQTLEESVRGFEPPHYGRVQRTGESYEATRRFTERVVLIAMRLYQRIERLDQTARLIRDLIEWALRRYHGYAIKERIRAHYRDASIQPHEKHDLVFEHVIPVRYVIGLLLLGRITVKQAMHPPTCTLRKSDHNRLEDAGLGDITPDIWHFWRRYADLGLDIVIHDGTAVDQQCWTLADHYKKFS